MVELNCLSTVLHVIPPLTYIISAGASLSTYLHYAKKDNTLQRLFCLASTWHLHSLKSYAHVGPNASWHLYYIDTP